MRNIVDEVFEEIEVNDIIEEIGSELDEDRLSDDVTASMIVVKTLQKLMKKLQIVCKLVH